MKLEFDNEERGPEKWLASTDNGAYDASGATPLDAVSALASTLENAIYEVTK